MKLYNEKLYNEDIKPKAVGWLVLAPREIVVKGL